MNVLILTPDAVGSTLLQRLITIYMQFHEFDRPVINIHELTNGIQKYYSPEFNREMLGKKPGGWGYYQSLEDISKILSEVDHYKIARLAQYHILNRGDILANQIPFYRFLNDNFFIISCRRRNVFENAISWCINNITKKLNVYDAAEKINSFIDLYNSKIEIDINSLYQALERYKNYLDWCEQFHVATYFYYEDHLNNIERFILDLPIFAAQSRKIGWNEAYGIDFSDYNRCNFYGSDIGGLALQAPERITQLLAHQEHTGREVTVVKENTFLDLLSSDKSNFIQQHKAGYLQSKESIHRMQELGILPGPLPIKKQTLAEKKYMIKNWDDCVELYNRWVVHYPNVGSVLSNEKLELALTTDQQYWKPNQDSTLALSAPPPI